MDAKWQNDKNYKNFNKSEDVKRHVIIGGKCECWALFLLSISAQGLGIWQKHQNIMGHLCIRAKLDKNCEVVKRLE
jgi:hypothetical protein